MQGGGMEKLLTTADVSKLLGISRTTLVRYIYEGKDGLKLKARRLGRGYRFLPEDVDAFIEASEVKDDSATINA